MSPLALWTGLILAAGGAYAARADAGPDAAPIPAEAQVVRDLDLRVSVADTPSDDGSSLTLRWTTDPAALAAVTGGAAPDTLLELQVERRTAEAREFTAAGRARCTAGVFEDAGLQPGASYTYRVGIVAADSVIHYSADAPPAAPRANLFRKYRLNALVITLLMSALVVGFIMAAKRGANLYIRRIAGLDAIDEAVGRATEMGRKILYIPGIISVSEPQTLASLGILGYVAKLAARYGTQLEVPNIDPLTMAAAREIVKEAYLEAGAPESFREEMVHYITADQFAYAAAVNGIMVRDRPAAEADDHRAAAGRRQAAVDDRSAADGDHQGRVWAVWALVPAAAR